jgi:uncharacterized protein (UPF0335 family)
MAKFNDLEEKVRRLEIEKADKRDLEDLKDRVSRLEREFANLSKNLSDLKA